MVITDLMHQRNYNHINKNIIEVSPPLISHNKDITLSSTTSSSAKALMNSAKICSKISRKNLKRL